MATKQPPIDRGWAWVILVAAFFEVLFGSTIYMSGVYNMIFLEEFGFSPSVTSWCAALHSSMISFMGPLTSLMISSIGSRKTVFIGTALAMSGYISCAFVSSFPMVFLTYGFIAGAGIGMAYMPGFVLLGFYFNRYRNIAYGIVTTASGFGTMIFAPLLDYLLEQYGWKGSMIVLAGILSHLFIAGAALRPVDFDIDTGDLIEKMATDVSDHVNSSLNISNITHINSVQVADHKSKDKKSFNTTSAYHLPSLLSVEFKHTGNGKSNLASSMSNLPSDFSEKGKRKADLNQSEEFDNDVHCGLSLMVERKVQDKTSHNGNGVPGMELNGIGTRTIKEANTIQLKSPNGYPIMLLNKNNPLADEIKSTGSHPNISNTEMQEKHLKYLNYSIDNVSKGMKESSNSYHCDKKYSHMNSLFSKMSSDFITQSYMSMSHLHLSNSKRKIDAHKTSTEVCHKENITLYQRVKVAYTPLLNSKFIIYCINLLFVNFGISIVYVHLPAYALETGSTQSQASRLLSIMGISNIISRLMTGLATNVNGLDVFIIYMGSCGLTGLVLCLCPLMGMSYFGKCLLAFVFGLYANCYIALMSPLTIALLGVEALTAAYGIELFICGIGFLTGPPLAGLVYDISGSYVYSLILGGIAYITGSLVMMLVPIFSTQPSQKQEEYADTDSEA